MSTALVPRPGGWASLLSLFLFLDLATCQTGTYKLASTPLWFQGFFVVNPTSVSTISCQTIASWYTSSTFGGCCATTTSCQMYTACRNGVLTQANGVVSTCPDASSNCFTRTIFPSSPYDVASTSWLRIHCGTDNFSQITVYREIVPTKAAAVTQTYTASAATVTIGPSSGSKPPTTALETSQPGANAGKGAEPTGTGIPAAGTSAAESSPSKAWIAGAVVGPLVAAAGGLMFLLFWLRKRRGEKKDAGDAAAGVTEPLQPQQQQQDAAAAAAGKHLSMNYPTSPGPPAYDPSVAKQPEMSVYYQNVAGYPPQSPPQSPPPQSPQSPQQQGYYPSQSPPPQGYYPSQSPPPQGYYPPQSPPPQSVHELAPTQPATMHELGPGQVPPPVHELDPTQVPPRAHELGPGQVAPQELAGS